MGWKLFKCELLYPSVDVSKLPIKFQIEPLVQEELIYRTYADPLRERKSAIALAGTQKECYHWVARMVTLRNEMQSYSLLERYLLDAVSVDIDIEKV